MGVSLTQFEQPVPFDGDREARIAALRERVARLQLSQIVHERRIVILFDGWAGAGKKDALRELAGALDPCHLAVHCVDQADADALRHWLAPYWSRLPHPGQTVAFFRSWYGDAVLRRADGELEDKAWARTCDEINEFEAQQTDHGTLMIKLFFHVPAEVQAGRLNARRADPWLGRLAGSATNEIGKRDALLSAWTDMLARCDTRWAKWTPIAGADEQLANIAALSAVTQALEKALPFEPPQQDAEIVPLVANPNAGARL